jgi:hypothetical protein
MKLNVVLRTCDRASLQSDRIVPKNECVWRCLKSLSRSLETSGREFQLHIVDDNSSQETVDKIQTIAPLGTTFDFLPTRDQEHLNPKQRSRYSVGVAYKYMYNLPQNELVYTVEDDYLHYPQAISKIVKAYEYFSELDPSINIGIFPQDFNQLYPHKDNLYSSTYVRPCVVVPGPDRYYRTTWFTHESFMITTNLLNQYKKDFDRLMNIGTIDGAWEGGILSDVWTSKDVAMMMPLGTHAIHLGSQKDISFFVTDWEQLWENNRV